MKLLHNGVHHHDVAQAHELALAGVTSEEFACEVFNIHSSHAFTEFDYPRLITNPSEVLEEYYPNVLKTLQAHDLTVPAIPHLFDIEKASGRLGYEPQYTFTQFIHSLT